jgi:type IV secretion system protein VirB4
MMLNLGLGALGVLGVTGASCLGLSLIPRIQKQLLPNPSFHHLHDYLPFDKVLNDGKTLLSKDGTYSQVLKIEGVNFNNKTEAEVEQLIRKRQAWLDEMSRYGATFKIFTVRRKISQALEAQFDQKVLQKIHESWNARFTDSFANQHYIVLTQNAHTGNFGRKKHKGSPGLLNEIASQTASLLSDFSPQCLEIGEGEYSPLLSFWASLIQGESCRIASGKNHLSQRVGASEICFEPNGLIRYQNGKCAKIVGLQLWGEESAGLILQQLQALPGEMVIYHLLEAKTKNKAAVELELSRRQSRLLGSQSHREAFEAGIELIHSEENSLFHYQLSIILLADNEPNLAVLIQKTKDIFHDFGITPVLNKQCAQWLWFSQFPSKETFIRPTRLLSCNLANFLSLTEDPVGFETSDWGQGPLRLMKTATGSIYQLQLHISDQKEALANALFIAPSGSGKTTLCQHLMGGALRHPDLRAFIFDRHNGTKIFTESVGGIHVDLSDNKGIPLNPFYCEDSPRNRAFLRGFFAQLANVSLDDPDIESRIAKALDILFYLPQKDRILNNILPLLDTKSVLRQGLQRWTGNNPLARWFNGSKRGEAFDALDVTASRLVTFEMTDILKDADLSAVVTRYMMHRIIEAVKERACPHWIFIDEAKQMIKCPIFKNYLDSLLLENRKLRGAITLCFQSAADILNSGMSAVILEQCPTRFLFPNISAKASDYAPFDLNPGEWSFIKGQNKMTKHLKHAVLVKRHQESVILDIDLSSMGSLMHLYRSGSECGKIMQQLKEQWGREWVEHYLVA